MDYGAIGDGKHYNTPHIQAAIDDCHAAGGGSVRFPAGNYLTGTIYLRSGVVLYITENATILGGTRLKDYPLESRKWYVVLAEKATNVGITGEAGIIDGQGGKFVEKMDERKNVMVSWNRTGACYGDKCRPKLVGFFDCQNVTVSDVILSEPAYWKCVLITHLSSISSFFSLSLLAKSNATELETQHGVVLSTWIPRPTRWWFPSLSYHRSGGVPTLWVGLIPWLHAPTHTDPNMQLGDFNIPKNNGVYIQDSNNTVIKDCLIDNGGHAIILKAHTGTVHNLKVIQSELRTRSSAIKLESHSGFGFKGLLFDHINVMDSHQGLTLQIHDGGSASDITFSNIEINTDYNFPMWWKRSEPIYVMTCPVPPHDLNSKVLGGGGSVTNLQFINISSHSEEGVFLSGSSEGVLSNLKFINVNLTYYRRQPTKDSKEYVLVDCRRRGCRLGDDHDDDVVCQSMAGMVMENIDGLQIENMKMRWNKSEQYLKGWNVRALDFSPSTVNNISLLSFSSGFI
ncbi:hypothetical protein BVC80_1125g7 [Macleaya cordata]|uniref:Uncharacterized protein n=1 Tax=Macleaya cordata TaxID=56857 RepID=A0A200Q6F5_MACCD|nr:hypothetical protein BVC80_1125g7 [Macleaya cordata]